MKESFFENINIQESTLPERTAQQISRLIVERRLTSEDRLPSEFELAELLNVGRGTIREGVKLLVARNVLEIRRGKGTYIASNPGEIPDPLGFAYCPDPFQLALDLAEVRGQLEPWIARMAAEHAAKEDFKRMEPFGTRCTVSCGCRKVYTKSGSAEADSYYHLCGHSVCISDRKPLKNRDSHGPPGTCKRH